MFIRQATIGDLDSVVELFDQYRIFYKQASDKEGARQFLERRINYHESIIYLIEVNEKDVGFVQLYPIFSSVRMKRMWLLNDLFVDSNYRGKGLSKALIEQCKKLCENSGAAGLMLETEKSNTIGNQLYPATGFQLSDNNYYYYWNT